MPQEETPRTVYWLENKLYLNITSQCSNNCSFCIRNFRKGVGDFCLKLADDPTPAQVISELEKVIYTNNWVELVFCGFGEPTARLDSLLEVTGWVRRRYGKPLRIRVNTNGHGYLLNPNRNVVKELNTAGVDKVSVSLNASNEKIYEQICKPKFTKSFRYVLDFIKKAEKELEVEVTAVMIPEVDLQKITTIAKELGVKLRLRQCVPCFW